MQKWYDLFHDAGIEVDMDVQHDGISEKIRETEDCTSKDATENKADEEEKDAEKNDEMDVSKTSEFGNENEKRQNDGSTVHGVKVVSVLKCA